MSGSARHRRKGDRIEARAMNAPVEFDYRAVEIGYFIAQELGDIDAATISFLTEINQRWPGLSFHDFMGAFILAHGLLLETAGNA
jgi:hypothetical protein